MHTESVSDHTHRPRCSGRVRRRESAFCYCNVAGISLCVCDIHSRIRWWSTSRTSTGSPGELDEITICGAVKWHRSCAGNHQQCHTIPNSMDEDRPVSHRHRSSQCVHNRCVLSHPVSVSASSDRWTDADCKSMIIRMRLICRLDKLVYETCIWKTCKRNNFTNFGLKTYCDSFINWQT